MTSYMHHPDSARLQLLATNLSYIIAFAGARSQARLVAQPVSKKA